MPPTLTARNAAMGSAAVSCMTWTRAARWITVFAPCNVGSQCVVASIRLTRTRPGRAPWGGKKSRTTRESSHLRRSSSAQSARPTKPLPPVTTMRFWFGFNATTAMVVSAFLAQCIVEGQYLHGYFIGGEKRHSSRSGQNPHSLAKRLIRNQG